MYRQSPLTRDACSEAVVQLRQARGLPRGTFDSEGSEASIGMAEKQRGCAATAKRRGVTAGLRRNQQLKAVASEQHRNNTRKLKPPRPHPRPTQPIGPHSRLRHPSHTPRGCSRCYSSRCLFERKTTKTSTKRWRGKIGEQVVKGKILAAGAASLPCYHSRQ